MHKDDVIRLRHMLEAAYEALHLSEGRQREDLQNDRMLLHALVRLIEVVGEAANQVSLETQYRHSQVPWRDIIGMRNRLIHAYFSVDIDRVWETIEDDLPRLTGELQTILDDTA